MITLKEITKDNWLECIYLKLNEDEKDFIAPNMYSIAEAQFYSEAESKAIYLGDKMIGYTLYGQSEDDASMYFIDRFMIDANFRNQGYAEEVFKIIIKIGKDKGYNILGSSTDLDNYKMQRLFEKLGFYTKGEIDEDELLYYINL